jgi:ABC-type transport system substrate-binding protein
MLIDRARKTLNGAKRLAYLKDAERIIVQDMPVVCLNYITLGVGFHQSLRHVAVSPMGLIRCEDIVKVGS